MKKNHEVTIWEMKINQALAYLRQAAAADSQDLAIIGQLARHYGQNEQIDSSQWKEAERLFDQEQALEHSAKIAMSINYASY